jgi:hypothetical protein
MKRFDCEQAELEWEKAMKIFKACEKNLRGQHPVLDERW